MAFIYPGSKFIDRPEHIFRGKVAEHERTHFRAGVTERLGGIIVAVRSLEDGKADHRMLHGSSVVNEVGKVERTGIHLRDGLIKSRLYLRRVKLGIARHIGSLECLEGHEFAVDEYTRVSDLAQQDRRRRIEDAGGLDYH